MNIHLAAAEQILVRESKPMHYKVITKIAVAEKLINDTKSPWATMLARIGEEIKKNGEKSKFIKVGRGEYVLRSIAHIQRREEDPNLKGKRATIDVEKFGMDAIIVKFTSGEGEADVTMRFTRADCKELVVKLIAIL